MRNHDSTDSPIAVLTAMCGRVRLGVPSSSVHGVGTLACSPTLPWSPPWWPGVALVDGRPCWLIDLVGLLRGSGGQREVKAIVTTGSAWALAITAPGAMTTALPGPAAEAPAIQGPTAWWRPCRFADGGGGGLVEAELIGARLAADTRRAS